MTIKFLYVLAVLALLNHGRIIPKMKNEACVGSTEIEIGDCTCNGGENHPVGCLCANGEDSDCYCSKTGEPEGCLYVECEDNTAGSLPCNCVTGNAPDGCHLIPCEGSQESNGDDYDNCLCAGADGEPEGCTCTLDNHPQGCTCPDPGVAPFTEAKCLTTKTCVGTGASPGECVCGEGSSNRPSGCNCKDETDEECTCSIDGQPDGCTLLDCADGTAESLPCKCKEAFSPEGCVCPTGAGLASVPTERCACNGPTDARRGTTCPIIQKCDSTHDSDCVCDGEYLPSGCKCTAAYHPAQCVCDTIVGEEAWLQKTCTDAKVPCTGPSNPPGCTPECEEFHYQDTENCLCPAAGSTSAACLVGVCESKNTPPGCGCPPPTVAPGSNAGYTNEQCLADQDFAKLGACKTGDVLPEGGCLCAVDNLPEGCTCTAGNHPKQCVCHAASDYASATCIDAKEICISGGSPAGCTPACTANQYETIDNCLCASTDATCKAGVCTSYNVPSEDCACPSGAPSSNANDYDPTVCANQKSCVKVISDYPGTKETDCGSITKTCAEAASTPEILVGVQTTVCPCKAKEDPRAGQTTPSGATCPAYCANNVYVSGCACDSSLEATYARCVVEKVYAELTDCTKETGLSEAGCRCLEGKAPTGCICPLPPIGTSNADYTEAVCEKEKLCHTLVAQTPAQCECTGDEDPRDGCICSAFDTPPNCKCPAAPTGHKNEYTYADCVAQKDCERVVPTDDDILEECTDISITCTEAKEDSALFITIPKETCTCLPTGDVRATVDGICAPYCTAKDTPSAACVCDTANQGTYTPAKCAEDKLPTPETYDCAAIDKDTPVAACACPTVKKELKKDPRYTKGGLCAAGSIRAALAVMVSALIIPALILFF